MFSGPAQTNFRYDILLDDVVIDWFDNLGDGSSRSAVGLEVPLNLDLQLNRIAPDNKSPSGDIRHYVPEYKPNSGDWILGWTQHYYVEWPCGTVPRCMNGTFYGSTQRSDNKPWQ